MGSIDNQYVSQVRSMAQQATDAAYAFYHRPQYDYPDQGAYLDYGRKDIYQHNYAGWLGTMGYQGALVLEDIESEDYNTYLPYIPSKRMLISCRVSVAVLTNMISISPSI